jgi:hypothetical protein
VWQRGADRPATTTMRWFRAPSSTAPSSGSSGSRFRVPRAFVSDGIVLERRPPNPAVQPGRCGSRWPRPGRATRGRRRARRGRPPARGLGPPGGRPPTRVGRGRRQGRRAAPGLYFYRLDSGGTVRVERQMLVAPGRP